MTDFARQLDDARARGRMRELTIRRMHNALDILAWIDSGDYKTPRALARFVRATANEGLGRDEKASWTTDSRAS